MEICASLAIRRLKQLHGWPSTKIATLLEVERGGRHFETREDRFEVSFCENRMYVAGRQGRHATVLKGLPCDETIFDSNPMKD